jgi:hypothetical protein
MKFAQKSGKPEDTGIFGWSIFRQRPIRFVEEAGNFTAGCGVPHLLR